MSGWDVEKGLKAQFPGATINRIDNVTPAQARAESTAETMRDQSNRQLDAMTGNGDLTKVRSVVGTVSRAWWTEIGCGKDEATREEFVEPDRHGRLTGRVYKVWEPADYTKHSCDGCGKDVFQDPNREDRKTWLCDNCRLELGFTFESENEKAKRLLQGMTRKRLGGLEILNENIGGQMRTHGNPALVAELRKRGILQTRKDQNGNPCEYMVAGSRKRQAEIIKEYNRRQKEAGDAGWRGTFSSSGVNVKKIIHGDQSDGL